MEVYGLTLRYTFSQLIYRQCSVVIPPCSEAGRSFRSAAWRERLTSVATMRVSSHQEEKDAKERRERRMTYATSLPAIKVPPHLQANSPTYGTPPGGHGVKHAATSVAYLQSPSEAPDRRLKERIYQSELDALRATENQVGRKVAQANIRSAWLADQLEQRKQEERELEHKVEQEKRKWLKRRELEAEVEKLRGQLKEAWGAIASGHSVEAEQHGQSAVWAVPQLGSCASSGCAWRLWAPRHAQGRKTGH